MSALLKLTAKQRNSIIPAKSSLAAYPVRSETMPQIEKKSDDLQFIANHPFFCVRRNNKKASRAGFTGDNYCRLQNFFKKL